MMDRNDQPEGWEAADAPLWNLLGKAEPPRVSPYFARRVLRESIRLDEEGGIAGRWLRRLTAGWRLPHPAWSGAFVAAMICAVTLGFALHPVTKRTRHVSTRADVTQSDLPAEINPRDVEVIANLDNLMTYEENRIWVDESSNSSAD